jgi:hypothetical protein
MPDTATEGTYRACTAIAPENYCAQIMVATN